MTSSATISLRPFGEKESLLAGGMGIVLAIAAARFALLLYFNDRYGYFRDEFDYMACGNHLAWGYVDQPPLVPFLVRMCREIFGDSLRSVRLVPALASSITVIQTALLARELGGRSYALVLAALAYLVSPQFLSNGSLLTTNCLEPLLWMACAYFALLAAKRNEPRYWLWFGVVAGIGMLEKYSISVLGFGIVIGLLLTPERRFLWNRWIWLGGLVSLVIFLPNLVWNIRNHFPFVELMHNIRAGGRNVALSPGEFFAQQIVIMNPVTAPLWMAGAAALLVSFRFKPYRMLGWAYLAELGVFIVLHGKNYYLAPIYPVLMAAGAVVTEASIERWRQSWVKPALAALLLAGGAALAPVVIPIFPPDRFLAYMSKLPIKAPRQEHSHERAPLPQHYADQFGWPELAAKVNEAWQRIPAEERNDCGIFAQNYGQAGAIDFFGRRYGLPPVLSGNQSYFLWGPRGYSGNCMIVVGDVSEVLEGEFGHVEYVGESDHPYALERHIQVFIAKRAKFGSLAAIWPRLKRWN
jgi:hypothetical protein